MQTVDTYVDTTQMPPRRQLASSRPTGWHQLLTPAPARSRSDACLHHSEPELVGESTCASAARRQHASEQQPLFRCNHLTTRLCARHDWRDHWFA